MRTALTYALGAFLGFPAVASAQHADSATAGSRVTVSPSGDIVVGRKSLNRGTLGFRVGGGFVIGPDGRPRFADYPAVEGVAPDSPAARAGILVGDGIVSVNGKDARLGGQVLAVPDSGITFNVRVRRGGEMLDFTMISALRPAAK